MSNIKLLLAYDGTDYRGWQKTRVGPSIESVLEEVLATILRHPVRLQAASRTDAGVHAKGQVVNFITENPSLNLHVLQRSLNGMLPRAMSVLEVSQMPDTFHPTIDAKGKVYHYHVCYGKTQLPFNRHYSWHFPYSLDLKKMEQAVAALIGKRDYSALTNVKKGETYQDHIRHIERITIEPLEGERLCFVIEGDHFLYKMVRNLVGTLCYVGCGKMDATQIESLLLLQDRRLMGVTAPAHGLSLEKVCY